MLDATSFPNFPDGGDNNQAKDRREVSGQGSVAGGAGSFLRHLVAASFLTGAESVYE